ncbi:F510_1955 family glycosylhydrolase [Paenarthrobacter sp. TYUT067]|uniref:F510_1955 family glycosylhydrolase n=1 Tax=unclassified Paenarthrobacter TaxID=2634190 RepID=UPI00202F687E|nr:exo-alpha-sialidase [Paenarthrobacter sp. TYUT067]MCM0616569.1 exo-alpha-sialidase [Paenarthrobacter sp. TYUT067]
MQPFTRAASRRGILLSGAALVLALAACTPANPPTTTAPSIELSDEALPSSHVHGLTVDPDTSQVLLATHDGLFDVTKQPATKIGRTNDLMGFTAGEDGVFYASGHPGPGSDLPNPFGLIKSTDGGQSWEKLSRQGESDFHAMTATKTGIIAYDGELRHSPDGKTWNTVAAMFAPAVLAGHPDSETILGTTTEGIQRSTDGGETWSLDKSGPVIQYAAFATPDEAAGVAPDGTTYYSADAGASWTKKGRVDGEVMAIAALKGADGSPWVWAATPEGIVVSTDGGTTFRPTDAS